MEKVDNLKPKYTDQYIFDLGQQLVCLNPDELQGLQVTVLQATANTIDERLAVAYTILQKTKISSQERL